MIEGDVWSYVWPTALIVVGLVAIARWAGAGALPHNAGDDVVVASGIFGGPTVANASQAFRGASLTAVFGGVVLDLRQARERLVRLREAALERALARNLEPYRNLEEVRGDG